MAVQNLRQQILQLEQQEMVARVLSVERLPMVAVPVLRGRMPLVLSQRVAAAEVEAAEV
jgi:hypothetical protein